MGDVETEDDLTQRHKKERKDLQSKIQALKKTAIKGDKKKKKEVQEEIAKLEADLDQKHNEEVESFKHQPQPAEKQEEPSVEVIEAVDQLTINPGGRVTKAQKRRDKKAAEMKEREQRILEQEKENENSKRTLENQTIIDILKKRKLMIFEIPSDGNCLYNAVDHQLKSKCGFSLGTDKLRLETSKQLKTNPEDYIPFLSDPNTGEILTQEQFVEYCDKVATTTNWGGQVELQALAIVVKHPVEVIQSEGPPLIMGEDFDDPVLTLTYHRHMYKLGEHYNSVQTLVEEDPL